MEVKAIYFDMDGTLADLYGFPNWLPLLKAESPAPYRYARPLIPVAELTKLLEGFRAKGIRIGVISWLSIDASPLYKAQIRKAKKDWIKAHFGDFRFDEIRLLRYGYPKHKAASIKHALLVDDQTNVLDDWTRSKKRIGLLVNGNFIPDLEAILS